MVQDKTAVLQQARQFVQAELGGDSSGHDWRHVERVAVMAVRLAKETGADVFICELAALLHDLADEKLYASKERRLEELASWLEQRGLEAEAVKHILDILSTMSFAGGQQPPVTTLEAQVVQDADRLDAMGAIGIARTFAYGGWKGHAIYDPERPPRSPEELTQEAYRSGRTTAVNHFYEKLLRLRDRMNTDAARRLAGERHRFMEMYLEQLYREMDGKL
ncbi:HD domain-containing protein [Paenibacillus sp. y28]|uniref:HD domain-containing protein n=1 Tax=Paenibacillus sp. y28 TaxID=3129110 RepID=UPI00301831BE